CIPYEPKKINQRLQQCRHQSETIATHRAPATGIGRVLEETDLLYCGPALTHLCRMRAVVLEVTPLPGQTVRAQRRPIRPEVRSPHDQWRGLLNVVESSGA